MVNGKYKSMNIDFTANPTGHGGQLQAKSSFFFFFSVQDMKTFFDSVEKSGRKNGTYLTI